MSPVHHLTQQNPPIYHLLSPQSLFVEGLGGLVPDESGDSAMTEINSSAKLQLRWNEYIPIKKPPRITGAESFLL